MFVELKPQLTDVAHRIDDLERIKAQEDLYFFVAHRIDDLEINLNTDIHVLFVGHRIDDLII